MYRYRLYFLWSFNHSASVTLTTAGLETLRLFPYLVWINRRSVITIILVRNITSTSRGIQRSRSLVSTYFASQPSMVISKWAIWFYFLSCSLYWSSPAWVGLVDNGTDSVTMDNIQPVLISNGEKAHQSSRGDTKKDNWYFFHCSISSDQRCVYILVTKGTPHQVFISHILFK